MDKAEQNDWVIKEDEAALEEKVLQKHHAIVKVEETPDKIPDNTSDNTKEKIIIDYPPSSHHIKKYIVSRANDTTSYISEEISFLLILIIVPYIIGAILLVLFIPILAGVNVGILLKATDLFDWSIHFLFWSVGYIVLSFLGILILLGIKR